MRNHEHRIFQTSLIKKFSLKRTFKHTFIVLLLFNIFLFNTVKTKKPKEIIHVLTIYTKLG